MSDSKMSFDGKIFNTDEELLQYVKTTHVKKVDGGDLKTQIYEEVKNVFNDWNIQVTGINNFNNNYKYQIILEKDNMTINQNAIQEDNICIDINDYEGNLNTIDGIINSIKNKYSKIINTLPDLNKISNITKIINFNSTYEQDGETPTYSVDIDTNCGQIHKEFDYFCNVDGIILEFQKHFITKLKGHVTISEDWGKDYYVDNTDVSIILDRAKKLHKEVRVEILD